MSDKQTKVSDIFEVKNGYAFKSKEQLNEPHVGTIEILKQGHIELGGGLRKTPKTFYVKKSAKLERYILNEGDIVVAMTDMKDNVALLGMPAIIKESNRYVLNQRVGWLHPKDRAYSQFFYYQMLTPTYIQTLQSKAASGVQVNLSTSAIKEMSLWNPERNIQQAIAEVLSSLDDKIDLLNRQNETLEAMAQTLFRQWFIEEADDSWEEEELGALVELTRGISYKGSDISVSNKEGVPIHSLKSMTTEGEYNFDGIKYYTASYKEKFSLDPGDLLMVNTDMTPNNRIIGWPILVPDSFKVSVSTHHLYSVKIIDQRITKLYLFYLLKTPTYRNLMANSANGTTVSMLGQAAIKALKITIPEIKTLKKFEAFIKPIDEKKSLNQRSIESLRMTRDTLLPKLMSGEVRVKLD